MTQLKNEILKLGSQGYSYNQIVKLLNCSKGTVCYHLGKNQKEKTKVRRKNYILQHPFIKKINTFKNCKYNKKGRNQLHGWKKLLTLKVELFLRRRLKGNKIMNHNFSVQDVINKFGEHPMCYITGEKINIYEPRTYNFDHIIPVSRGGDNSIDNLGICTKQANAAKSDMTYDELIVFCNKVIEHNKLQKLGSNQHPLD